MSTLSLAAISNFPFKKEVRCFEDIIDHLDSQEQGSNQIVQFVSFHVFNASCSDQRVFNALSSAELCVVDGIAIHFFRKFLFSKDLKIIPGSDFFFWSLQNLQSIGKSHLIICPSEEIKSLFIARMNQTAPYLNFAVAPAIDKMDYDEFSEELLREFPEVDCVWLGIGSPQQNILSYQLGSLFKGRIFAIGAAVEMYARENRAPAQIRKLHLEWAWRILRNPRKYLRRYTFEFLQFLGIVIKLRFSWLKS